MSDDLIRRSDAIKALCCYCVASRGICKGSEYLPCEDVRAIMVIPTIETKQIKYFDEEEKVWKIGNIIVESK